MNQSCLNPFFKWNMVVVLFFFHFAVQIKGIPLNTAKYAIVILLIYHALFYRFSFGIISRSYMCTVIAYAIFLIIGALISLIFMLAHYSVDLLLPYTFLLNLFESFLGVALILDLIKRKGGTYEDVLEMLVQIITIQSIIVLTSLMVQPVREFFWTINKREDIFRDIYRRYFGFRGVGFSSAVTFDLSVFMSLGMIICTYLFFWEKKKNYHLLLFIVINLLGLIVSGRTGFFGLLIVAVLLLMSIGRKINKLLNPNTIGYVTAIIVIIFVLFKYIASSEQYNQLFQTINEFAFEAVINYFEQGEITTSSTDVLKQMSFTPDEKTLLWGDGYWVYPFEQNKYYCNTDVGYLRHILYYGLFPTIFMVFAWILFGILAGMKYYRMGNFPFAVLMWLLILYYLLVQYKGDFILGSGMNMKLYYILFMLPLFFNVSLLNSFAKNKKRVFSQ